MTSRFFLIAAATVVTAFCATSVKAEFVNGSFETGDLTGWETLGQVTAETAGSSGVTPPFGVFQAFLYNHRPGNFGVPVAQVESFLGIESGALDAIGNGVVTQGSAMRQTFSAQEGESLSFNWNFLTNSSLPDPDFDDFAFVLISPTSSTQELADTFGPLGSSGSAFFASETGYQSFSYSVPRAGTYTLAVGVVDVGDGLISSGLFIDGFAVTTVTVIPEPSSSMLMVTGLAATVLLSLRRRGMRRAIPVVHA